MRGTNGYWVCLSFLALLCVTSALCEETAGAENNNNRKGKFFSVLQVVQFQNTGCTATTTRNGTCYTSDQCKTLGGTPSGSTCASGYGVCCLFSIACGATSSQNCTYLVQASTTKAPATNPCLYTICPTSTSVCRLRLDFTSFTIASPAVGTTVDAAANAVLTNGGAIGSCVTDSFSVTAPGSSSTPAICGANTGQHIYVDSSAECNVVSFGIGAGDTTSTRAWDIKVTQYNCDDPKGGPTGCLQYFTGMSGTVSSFNFPIGSTVGPTATHLANQKYSICFRQEANKCQICFTTAVTNTAAINTAAIQTSFGLSASGTAAAAQAQQDANCKTDYLLIPGASTGVIATPVATNGGTGLSSEKFCGRVLDRTASSATVGNSVCTAVRPFQLQFVTDGTEATTAAQDATTNEQFLAPGGIVGFSLNWVQGGC
jgi:hypothetical protein